MKDWDGKTHLSYVRHLVRRGGPEASEYAEVDEWIRTFYAASDAGRLNAETLSAIRKAMTRVLSPTTMHGWAYCKPHGYAGDFEIIDRHYLTYICAEPGLINWDHYWQSGAAARAVRNRKAYFHQLIREHLHSHDNGQLKVLNLASGPGRDVFEFLSESHGSVHFDCVDHDAKAIYFAANLCRDHSDRVRFVRANVIRLRLEQRYDLIWAAGLFDYFSDSLFRRVLQRLLSRLKPDGEVVIGNFSLSNPNIHWMRFCEWNLQHRSGSQLRKLAASAGPQSDTFEIGREEQGVNLFLHIRAPKLGVLLGTNGHCSASRDASNSESQRPNCSLLAEKRFIETLVEKGGPDPSNYLALNNWFCSIHEQTTNGQLSSADLLDLREAFGDAVSLNTLQGLVCIQQHGYPGDFEIIDRIYVRHISGRPDLMRWDAYFHAQTPTKAVRNRKEYFHWLLDQHYARCHPLRVLNLGSGPGRCMFEWLSSRSAVQAYFHCVEIDPDAITYASLLNQGFLSQITFELRNVLRFSPAGQFDLIWAAGLFDYFSDRVFQLVLRKLLPAVEAGGELVIGNFTSDPAARAYMEFGGWKLHTRNAATLSDLAQSCGVAKDQIGIGAEPEGLNLFLHISMP